MPLIPSTYTVQDVLTAIKRQFGDESGAQLTDTDIIRWINEGQLEIARKNKYSRTSVTTPSVSSQANYNLAGVNILSIESVFYGDYPITGETYEQVQESYLKSYSTTSFPATSTNVPLVWYEYGDSIYFWPPPTVAGDIIKLLVCTYPTKLTSAVDSLSIPDTYYQALLDFIMSKAYEMDDDPQASMAKYNRHTDTINELASASKAVNNHSYPTITILPEDL